MNEYEKIIIGILLRYPSIIPIAMEIVDYPAFANGRWASIYKAIGDLYMLGETIDYISVARRAGCMVSLLIEITEQYGFTDTMLSTACERVQGEYLKKQVGIMLGKYAEQTQAIEPEHIFGYISEIEKMLNKIQDKKADSDINTIISSVLKEIEKEVDYIPTPYQRLNNAIIGYIPTHLWILGGYTSSGKSSVLIDMIVHALQYDAGVMLFSTEMSNKTNLCRMIANIIDIPYLRLIQGDWKPFLGKAEKAISFLRQKNLCLYDDIYTLKEIALKVKQQTYQGQVDLVCIDYIQAMRGEGKSVYDKMAKIAFDLADLAKSTNTTVIGLSQVSHENIKADNPVIGFKGAGEIAAAADIALWIDRKSQEGKRDFDLIIRKNRHGKIGRIPMSFNDTFTGVRQAG